MIYIVEIPGIGARRNEMDRNKIEALEIAAGQAGDLMQAAICQLAINGDVSAGTYGALSDTERARINGMSKADARAECARVILDAEGRQD